MNSSACHIALCIMFCGRSGPGREDRAGPRRVEPEFNAVNNGQAYSGPGQALEFRYN